jgi:hypothetical protein
MTKKTKKKGLVQSQDSQEATDLSIVVNCIAVAEMMMQGWVAPLV